MLDWLSSLFSTFLSPWGLLALSVLDSSIFFVTPLAIDLAVILASAHDGDRFWLYALIATAGSLAGIAATYWIGRHLGEPGLKKVLSEPQLARAKRHVRKKGAIAMGLLAIVPPPFPLTPLVVASGALEVQASVFFTAAAAARAVRFGAESLLARRYGSRIAGWLESPLFEVLVGLLIAIAVLGTAKAVYDVSRARRREREA